MSSSHSAQTKVLSLPELLFEIFSYLILEPYVGRFRSPATLPLLLPALTVNKLWSGVAERHLYAYISFWTLKPMCRLMRYVLEREDGKKARLVRGIQLVAEDFVSGGLAFQDDMILILKLCPYLTELELLNHLNTRENASRYRDALRTRRDTLVTLVISSSVVVEGEFCTCAELLDLLSDCPVLEEIRLDHGTLFLADKDQAGDLVAVRAAPVSCCPRLKRITIRHNVLVGDDLLAFADIAPFVESFRTTLKVPLDPDAITSALRTWAGTLRSLEIETWDHRHRGHYDTRPIDSVYTELIHLQHLRVTWDMMSLEPLRLAPHALRTLGYTANGTQMRELMEFVESPAGRPLNRLYVTGVLPGDRSMEDAMWKLAGTQIQDVSIQRLRV